MASTISGNGLGLEVISVRHCVDSRITAHRRGRPSSLTPVVAVLFAACGPQVVVDPPLSSDCLASGDHLAIQAALGGPGSTVKLCPGAVFELGRTVEFTADGQRIVTEGLPTDDRRAVLRVASASLTTAVSMMDRSHVELSHVVVDGARPRFGPGEGALIQAGGDASGQVVRAVKAYEPRGWTTLHLFEGGERSCTGAFVADGEFGPAGQPDGSWADGISLACRNSVVRDNLIVDATDGGIVVFGAPGSLIEGNTIRSETRASLGGINMVDFIPFDGDYRGTRVIGNLIDASGSRIQIGLGMGWRVWTCFDPGTSPWPDPTLRGAVVADNILRGRHMRYGFAADGVADWTVTGNQSVAAHTGTPSGICEGRLSAPPAAFQRHGMHAQGDFQVEFSEGRLEMALWTVDVPPR